MTPDERSSRGRIVAAGGLMSPGGGSLETNDAFLALHLICLAQQDEIDELRRLVDATIMVMPLHLRREILRRPA